MAVDIIRKSLDLYLHERGYSRDFLANMLNISGGELSKKMTGQRTLDVSEIVQITDAIGFDCLQKWIEQDGLWKLEKIPKQAALEELTDRIECSANIVMRAIQRFEQIRERE